MIGEQAFSHCSSLTSVVIPPSVGSLGAGAFYGCGSLASVTLPGCIPQIPEELFACTGLTSVTIPDGVNAIRYGAFYGCDSLTCVTMPDSVLAIYSSAFGSSAVTRVVYSGALTDLEEISVSAGNEPLTGAVWHCGGGDYAFPGASSGYLTDGIQWSLTDGSLTISGHGAMPDGLVPWYFSRDVIVSVTVGEGVTAISKNAFSDLPSLMQASLPSTLRAIGDYAFTNCASLTSVRVPDGVVSLGYGAFEGCAVLSDVSLPETLASVGGSAFAGCKALSSVALPGGIDEIPENLFGGSGLTFALIPEHVGTIGPSAFAGCRSLTGVSLPAAVSVIRSDAFCGASRLTEVTYGGAREEAGKIVIGLNNASLIGAAWTFTDGAGSFPASDGGILSPDFEWRLDFNGKLIVSGTGAIPDCDSSFHAPWRKYAPLVRTLVIEPGVKAIGAYAFSDFSGLTCVCIPDTVTRIGDGAFGGSVSLTGLVLPESVTSIGDYAFERSGLTEIALPDSVIELGEGVFRDCGSLSSLTLSAGLTVLPRDLCAYSDALLSVVLPEHVRGIGDSAFRSCGSLESITLPQSLQFIENGAFAGCGISEVTFPGTFAEAAAIRIGTNNTPLMNAVWHCEQYDGTIPTLTGGRLTDTVSWSISGSILTVSGSGLMPDFSYDSPAPWHSLSPGITAVVIAPGVRNIGSRAFSDMAALEEVSLPSTVTRIGAHAFASTYALQSLTIPESVTVIEYGAFEFSGLRTLVIPDSVARLEESAFAWCCDLTGIIYASIPESALSIAPDAFDSGVIIVCKADGFVEAWAMGNGFECICPEELY